VIPAVSIEDARVRSVEIAPSKGRLSLKLRDFWEYRELLFFLVWRDVKVRYKQTALGMAWAIVQPLTATLIFSLVFGRLARLPSEGMPYVLFSYTGMLAWSFVATGVARAATSLVSSANLITKVYFPRLLVPTAGALAGVPDFAVSFVLLLGMMGFYRVSPTANILALPLFGALGLTVTLGFGFWLSAINARYRDVGHIMPFLIQMWLYASPVAYSADLVPERWRVLYSLNPMAGVVAGFRWAILGGTLHLRSVVVPSIVVAVAILVSGALYFRWKERTIADVI